MNVRRAFRRSIMKMLGRMPENFEMNLKS